VTVEDRLEVGLPERVDVMFQDDRLAVGGSDLRVDLGPVRPGAGTVTAGKISGASEPNRK
jgi:hypothetical protein